MLAVAIRSCLCAVEDSELDSRTCRILGRNRWVKPEKRCLLCWCPCVGGSLFWAYRTRISAPIELTVMEEGWQRHGDRKSKQGLPEPSWLLRRTAIVRHEGEARLWQLTTTRRTKSERLPCLSHVEACEAKRCIQDTCVLFRGTAPSTSVRTLQPHPLRLAAAAVPQQLSHVLTADWSDLRSVCRQAPPQRQK